MARPIRAVVLMLVALLIMVGSGPLITVTSAHPTQQDDAAPFLIYWDDVGFRVERADGSASVLFGEQTLDRDGMRYTRGRFSLSPSGEWLHISAMSGVDAPPAATDILVNLYTGAEHVLIDTRTERAPVAVEWHPTTDRLLLLKSDRVQIVTPTTGADFLANPVLDMAVPHLLENPPDARVTLAGFGENVGYVIYDWAQATNATHYVELLVFNDAGVLFNTVYGGARAAYLSPGGLLMLQFSEALRFLDLNALDDPDAVVDFFRLPMPPDLNVLTEFDYQWGADGHGVLLEIRNEVQWVALRGNDRTRHTFSGTYTLRSDANTPWREPMLGWSPDGTQYPVVDVANGGTVLLNRNGDATPLAVAGYPLAWGGDALLLAEAGDPTSSDPPQREVTFHVVDVSTGTTQSAPVTLTGSPPPALLPDGETVLYNANGLHVVDLVTGEQVRRPPDARSASSFPTGTVDPHPTAPYVLVQTAAVPGPTSDADGPMRWLSVQSLDSTSGRDIPTDAPLYGWADFAVAQWLPARVDTRRLHTAAR